MMIYQIASDGTIQDQFEVILTADSQATSERMGGFFEAFVLPVPAVLVAIEPFIVTGDGSSENFAAAFSASVKAHWPQLLGVFAVALVLAAMVYRRSRLFGLPKRQQIAWAVFVFLLGLPAYVGYLLHRRWPFRQPCPRCQRSAPRDRSACTECGDGFPEPARTGIEIFA